MTLPHPLDPTSISILRSFLDQELPIRRVFKRFKHTSLGGAGSPVDTDIFVLPPNAEILTCTMEIETAFAHAATYTLSVGPGGAETTLLTAQTAKTTGLKLVIGTDFTTNRPLYSSSAGTTIQTRATVGSGDVNTSTAGVVRFNFLYVLHQK